MDFLKKKYRLVVSRNHDVEVLDVCKGDAWVKLLDQVFDAEHISRSATLMDLYRYRIYNGGGMVKKALTRRDKLPFNFIVYNN